MHYCMTCKWIGETEHLLSNGTCGSCGSTVSEHVPRQKVAPEGRVIDARELLERAHALGEGLPKEAPKSMSRYIDELKR
jgi:predicted  nucleic acid-binding Zn-ribbon protein